MKVSQCTNGHYFDEDQFGICPLCGSLPKEEKKKERNQRSRSLFELFIHRGLDKEEAKEEKKVPEKKVKPSVNEGLLTDVSRTETVEEETADEQEKAVPEKTGSEELTALQTEFKRLSSNDEMKTVSYFSAEMEKMKGIQEEKDFQEPIVGWLVCVKGSHFGECFTLLAGKNSIGRNECNRIVLDKDARVSREKHAVVIYEPKKREFYLQPGSNNGLTYLNDTFINETTRMQDGDLIEIGDTVCLLKALCGESFAWETYMEGK